MRLVLHLRLAYGFFLMMTATSDAWRISCKLPEHGHAFEMCLRRRGGSDPPSESSPKAFEDSSFDERGNFHQETELNGNNSTNGSCFDDSQPNSDDSVEEQLLVDDPTIDEDSSSNVDRMEYADAYDEEDDESSSVGYGAPEYTYRSVASDEPAVDRIEIENENLDNQHKDLPTIQLSSIITEDMKKVMMKDLNYKSSDLEVIRPEIASLIVAKDVRRPVEGLPSNWYKEGMVPKSGSIRVARKRIFVACAVVAVAMTTGSMLGAVDFSVVTESLAFFLRKSIPTSRNIPDQQDGPGENVSDVDQEDDATKERFDHEEQPDSSVRPGQDLSPEPVDELWLDKVITAVISGLEKLFRV